MEEFLRGEKQHEWEVEGTIIRSSEDWKRQCQWTNLRSVPSAFEASTLDPLFQ